MYLNKIARFNLGFNACYANSKRISMVAWSNNLFVNYLKLPNFKGPTAEEVMENVDLTDKKCLITGGTSGIGVEIVRCLMAKNCKVVMACRNPYAAHVLSKTAWNGFDNFTIYDTNFASLASVKKTCDEILKKERTIDIVILNAAVFGIPWTLTEDQLETVFQVNFLSQFYLLLMLQSVLTSDARVVFMSADSHRNIKWSVEDTISPSLDMICLPKNDYTSIKAYNISKLCGILAMHYLNHRWSKMGQSVFCAHPGSFVKTNLCTNWWPYEILYTVMHPFSKNIAQAAATPLYCATSPSLQGYSDLYFSDCKSIEPSSLAQDTYLSWRIVDLSKNVLKERVGFADDVVPLEKVEKDKFGKQIKKPMADTDVNHSETPKNAITESVLSA